MTRLNQRIDRPLPPTGSSTFVLLMAVGPPIALFVALAIALVIAAWPRPAHAGGARIAKMNAALHRYVRPTGLCGVDRELMATLYGNGDGLVGKPVACGGVLDRRRATVASRTYPCGARLELGYRGRRVEAVVTDWGPGTIADLDLGPAVWAALRITTSTFVCARRIE